MEYRRLYFPQEPPFYTDQFSLFLFETYYIMEPSPNISGSSYVLLNKSLTCVSINCNTSIGSKKRKSWLIRVKNISLVVNPNLKRATRCALVNNRAVTDVLVLIPNSCILFLTKFVHIRTLRILEIIFCSYLLSGYNMMQT